MTKKIKVFMAAVVATLSVFAAEMPIAEARAKIGDAIADSNVMAQMMKSLSAENQKAYVGEVNSAIAKMPGSTESKTSAFLIVNRTALQNAAKGNMKALLSEIFATVPAESLTILNESFAKDFFNRTQPGNDKLSDAQFEQIAKDVVGDISKRTQGMKDSDVRIGFAAIMFIRASNGQPADLTDKLVAIMPEDTRNLAKSDWIPAALGQNQEKSYEPMLGAADAGRQPEIEVVMRTAGPQIIDALLADMVQGIEIIKSVRDPENLVFPVLDDGNAIPPLPEPHGYSNTSTGWKK